MRKLCWFFIWTIFVLEILIILLELFALTSVALYRLEVPLWDAVKLHVALAIFAIGCAPITYQRVKGGCRK